MKKKVELLLLLLTIVLGFGIIHIVHAFSYTDTYPYPNATQCQSNGNGCVTDPWSFYKRECTSYAAHMINQSGVPMVNGMSGPNGQTGWFGNAGNWDDNASNIGYTVDSNPTIGSIAVWDPNACSGCTVGHVAYVREVHTDGSVFISEYNWNGGDGNYSERDSQRASHYIHFTSGASCGGANIVISNQEINSGTTCTASGSITISPTTIVRSSNGTVVFKIQ